MNPQLLIRIFPVACIAVFVLICGEDIDRASIGGALVFAGAMAGGVVLS